MAKKIIQKFIMVVQKIIITSSLIVIYFAGFGITLIFVLLFKRKVITGEPRNGSVWIEAEGYEPDINDAVFQS